MKKIFVILFAIIPALTVAQTEYVPSPFIINGKVGHLNAPARAYIFYRLGANSVVDSSEIVNGAFKFNGNALDPAQAFIVIDHSGNGSAKLDPKTADGIPVFLEKGTTNVISVSDSISKAAITGSPVNDGYAKLTGLLLPIKTRAEALRTEENSTPASLQNTDAFRNADNEKHKVLAAEQTAILEKFVKDNPDNFVSLMVISELGKTQDVSELKPLYDGLGQDVKNMETGKQIKRSIDALLPTAMGAVAPDFTQNDVNGTPVVLSSFRGKYVLIDFWASWCGPCRQENPNVVKAYLKFKNKNFTVLGVSLDKQDGKADWISAIKSDGLTWTQVSDLDFWQNKVALLYGVQSIPHNFLLDPTGKIIAKDLRGIDLDNKLTELFGKM